jgi:hypothetical protein
VCGRLCGRACAWGYVGGWYGLVKWWLCEWVGWWVGRWAGGSVGGVVDVLVCVGGGWGDCGVRRHTVAVKSRACGATWSRASKDTLYKSPRTERTTHNKNAIATRRARTHNAQHQRASTHNTNAQHQRASDRLTSILRARTQCTTCKHISCLTQHQSTFCV